MSSELLTHKALADLLGVSETTVKSYRRKFPGCIPVASQGKPIRFTEQAATVALRIRDLFATGMSVEEVRRRLAGEFSWIEAQAPASTHSAGHKAGEAAPQPAPVSPELALGVSNMAKSMVTITGQQKSILDRVKGIEAALEDMGVAGIDVNEEERLRKAEQARQKEERLETRLAQLDAVTKDLAGSLAMLAEQFGKFVSRQQAAAGAGAALAGAGGGNVAVGVQPGGEPVGRVDSAGANLAGGASGAAAPSPAGVSVTVFPAATSAGSGASVLAAPASGAEGESAVAGGATQGTPVADTPAVQAGAHDSGATPFTTQGQPEVLQPMPLQAEPAAAEPARAYFTLRLVVRHPDGTYSSVGGRSRGRFCLDDFKALLLHRYPAGGVSPMQFSQEGNFWRVVVALPEENAVLLDLLLDERMTHKGFAVLEVAELKVNQRAVHPSEICAVIDTLVG